MPNKEEVPRGRGYNRLLLLADEAMSEGLGEGPNPSWTFDHEWVISPEAPERDWFAEETLLLARIQLDQMIEIVRRVTGVSIEMGSPRAAVGRLEEMVRPLVVRVESETDHHSELDDIFDGEPAVWEVWDGLDLLESLSGSYSVSNAFAIDGSVSLTVGPVLPRLESLGFNGGETSELIVAPSEVLDVARRATEHAAAFAVLVAGE